MAKKKGKSLTQTMELTAQS